LTDCTSLQKRKTRDEAWGSSIEKQHHQSPHRHRRSGGPDLIGVIALNDPVLPDVHFVGAGAFSRGRGHNTKLREFLSHDAQAHVTLT
jgi:hypothetical protein